VAISVNAGMNRGRRSRGPGALSEINVTPFVDVALVLLIIFMITANVMEYGLDINVPKTKSVASAVKNNPVVVQIDKTGNTYLGKEPLNVNRMVDTIHAKYPGQTAVYIRADGQTPWDPIANVVSILHAGDAKLQIRVMTTLDSRVSRKR
jgi:biopolymer transport protein ExbD